MAQLSSEQLNSVYKFYLNESLDKALQEIYNLGLAEGQANAVGAESPAPVLEAPSQVSQAPAISVPISGPVPDVAVLPEAPVDETENLIVDDTATAAEFTDGPVDTAPVDTAPVDTAPVDTAPVDAAPATEATAVPTDAPVSPEAAASLAAAE